MKLTIYTVNDCQFSKAEKEYLTAHNVSFEEKNMETNKEYLTEMLAVSNNFAGTPVTKIEKDDGQISVLKGYTKEDLDKALGYSQPKETVVNSTIDVPQVATPPAQPQPQPPTQPPPATQEPAAPPETSDALNSVLQDLQNASSEPTPPKTETPPPVSTPTPTPTSTTPTALPDIPDFKDK